MVGSLVLAAALGTSPALFGCSWVESEQDDPFFLDVVELRAGRHLDENGEFWTLEWADDRTAKARAHPAEPGQFGERTRVEWSDKDGVKQAFVSRLPDYQEGQEMVFIDMNEETQDGPPGYICLAPPPEEGGQ